MEYLTTLPKDTSKAYTSIYGLEYAHPIEYYDFHVYYVGHNSQSVAEATSLRSKLLEDFEAEGKEGSIIVKKLKDHKVIGPHVTHFWEVDVVRPEIFVRLLSWFQLYHGTLSVLIHPQTGEDLLDHTSRALWLGKPLPIIESVFNNIGKGIPEFGVPGGKRLTTEEFEERKRK
ncbi:hypothetical protein JA9_001486 [Meyerozyma sp. JA9]|nr:hypothetical protein JA9_001486 [Meyerozyma sp. JA9]